MTIFRFRALLFCALIACTPMSLAQQASGADTEDASTAEPSTAPVIIDGDALFPVRGISTLPPEKRAKVIADRIRGVARNATFATDKLRVIETDQSTDIFADSIRLVSILDADASLEGVARAALAVVYVERIRQSIEDYRLRRTAAYLQTAVLRAAAATAAFAMALWAMLWLMRRLSIVVDTRYKGRVRSVAIQSFHIVESEKLWSTVKTVLRTLRWMLIAAVAYLYLHFVLMQFPWTRTFAAQLLGYLTDPLLAMGRGLLNALPDLIFLGVLFVVVRGLLQLLRLFFDAIGDGTVKLQHFEPDWAVPTYRLVRLGVVVFAAVVAYPFIPGSGSEAFKGISIFLGVVFSIGSSSFVSNMVAGYALTYRRAFRIGDRVQIEGFTGDVVQTRLQVTHLCSLKNEEVIVPNSLILNSQVVNYSSLARQKGLILHTSVGIGYETPWRKVESLLLSAANATQGLLNEPTPFVLVKTLGEFYITYELNVFSGNALEMHGLKTALNCNILDAFNQGGVQIMTPTYEGDPPQPKVVPKDQWFVAPASDPVR